MKYPLICAVLCVGVSGAALADTTPDTAPDFVFFDAQIAALQHRVDAGAGAPGVNREALTAALGKQQELTNQEAKMKQAGAMTADEKEALALSIRQQQQRLNGLTQAAMPAMKHVDPASVPAPTYVTPYGSTISGAPGTTPAQTGVVPLQQAPVMQVPTVQGPSVPIIHAPMPQTGTPTQ